NQILAIAGKDRLPIYDDEVTQLISLSMTVLSSLWAWWKNNSFTQDARAADEYLKQIRTQRIQAKKRKG
ncbi:MAG: phage holin, partial [Eubacteriales bacterium]|nr:phage holin [Eubacteriales bacterium]